MSGDRPAAMRRNFEVTACLDRQGKVLPDERPDPREQTARMLSDAIVRIYRLSGWPPWRVASELSVGVGSRQDVLRWARDGVPQRHRDTLFQRVEDLEERFRRSRHWGPERVRRLRERVGCRLDLALEAGVELETVRQWERGEERPTRHQAERLRTIERRQKTEGESCGRLRASSE